MSIWIRRRQAEKRARQRNKEHAARRRRPALEALSLPEDLTGNSMRLILMGERRALVENCMDVIEIDRQQIRLRTSSGVMQLQGSGLSLEDVRAGALAVSGKIESVQLLSEAVGGSGAK